MKISQHIQNTIEGWTGIWADRLRSWFAWIFETTTERVFDFMEKPLTEQARPLLEAIRDNPETPPEFKQLIEDALVKKSFAFLPILIGILIGGIGSMGLSQLAPSFKKAGYFVSKLAKDYRLDPFSVITAWRRDKPTYEKYFDDLRDQGWSDERIETLKFVTLFMPSAGDIVRWYAREVYEPTMIDRYGLEDELPGYEASDFPKIGVDATQAKNYWMAHWEHASYMQVREMLHRGVLTLDKTMPTPPTTIEGWAARDAEGIQAAYEWYRLVEIPPFWRDRLTEMMYNIPTRVDVRRWWDMRTISEERLRSIYHSQGYHGDDLDDYVLWTKVYTAWPDLIARFKNGWISEDDVRSELTALGMPPERIEEMLQTKIKPAEPERTTAERDLTKTDIYRGVKLEVISWSEGIELLMDMGYSEDEAEFILTINVGAAEGSPETYAEFKQWTQLYRKSQGLPAKLIPGDVLEASKALKSTTEALRGAQEKGLRDEKLAPYLQAQSAAEYRYRQLLAKWREMRETQ